MITQTNAGGVSFVVANIQTIEQSTNTTNAVASNPVVLALEPLTASQMAGRAPGGQAFRKGSNGAYIPPNSIGTVVTNTNAGVVQIDGYEIGVGRLNTTKAGAFLVSLTANTAATLSMFNTAINTNSQAGDTTFSNWQQITFYNLTGMGIDNSTAGQMTILGSNTNGANFGASPANALGGMIVQAGSAFTMQNLNGNGTAIAANAAVFTVNSTTAGLFAVAIAGN